jgi:ABC-type Zn uptake system ZnuABC Zn-binding protein ZnuA
MNKKNLFLNIVIIFQFIQAIAQQKPLVVASATIFADMAENISGGLVEVKSIVPVGGDPHIYEPTPGDAKLVAEAQLILKNGLTFEGWLDELIENSGTQGKIVTITQGIEPISSSVYKNSTDPHAWMDPVLGSFYLKNVKDALVELLPEQADIFNFNHDLYQQQLADLNAYIEKEIQTIPKEKRILITSHDAFRYFGKRFGLQVESVLGTSTDADVQTSDIRRLTDVIEKFGVPSVFIETTVNPALLQQIARDNNVSIGGSLYSDSLGDKNSPASTYLEMLKFNADTIVKGLTKQIQTEEKKSFSKWIFVFLGLIAIAVLILFIKK